MVHRPERLADIFCLMRKYKIEPKRVRMVHPNTKKSRKHSFSRRSKRRRSFLKMGSTFYMCIKMKVDIVKK